MFKIHIALKSVTQITPQLLSENGIKGLLLDIDNTLTTHDNPVPAEGVVQWTELMKRSGIKMYIVSNNHPPRVEPFAKMLGIPFVSDGRKPLSKGFKEGLAKMGLKKSETAAVGDQIYTDVLAAGLFGVRCIYVVPIEPEKTRFFRFKRKMEKPFLPKKFYSEPEGK